MDLQPVVENELRNAQAARDRGNEGQARVCARRAAGTAIRDYLQRRGRAVRSPSSFDLLRLISEDPTVPPALRDSASRLILRVDAEFRLPPEIDLIAEARKLCEGLAIL